FRFLGVPVPWGSGSFGFRFLGRPRPGLLVRELLDHRRAPDHDVHSGPLRVRMVLSGDTTFALDVVGAGGELVCSVDEVVMRPVALAASAVRMRNVGSRIGPSVT
ncbi:hypothetical protein ACFQ1S_35425, partial [Kibdelosporangium lantanae]